MVSLEERIVRVEEELKHQREMLQLILNQMDKRFEDMNTRFDMIFKFMGIGFSAITILIVVFKFIH